MKLKYADVEGGFYQALQDLQIRRMPPKTAYAVDKILTQVQKMLDQARIEHKEIVKQFCFLDEKGEIKSFPGEPLLDPAGQPMLDPRGNAMASGPEAFRLMPEKKADYEAALKEFFQKEVEIMYGPFSIEEMGNEEFTPEHIHALQCIFVQPETEVKQKLKSV